MSLDERIMAARDANLALYLENPSPQSAQILVIFEKAVERLRRERPQPPEQAQVSPTFTCSAIDPSSIIRDE